MDHSFLDTQAFKVVCVQTAGLWDGTVSSLTAWWQAVIRALSARSYSAQSNCYVPVACNLPQLCCMGMGACTQASPKARMRMRSSFISALTQASKHNEADIVDYLHMLHQQKLLSCI